MLFRSLLILPALAMLTTAATITNSYTPAEDYSVKFSTTGAEGTFTDLQGMIVFDAEDLATAKFEVSVATSTIQTGNKTKDKHAQSDNWLDAEAHPRIQFVSSAFAKTNNGYLVDGQLTIAGQSEPIQIPFTFTDNTFIGSTTVNRKSFGIEGPFMFGSFVGDEVDVSLRIPVKSK